ncbi:T9SS type A sorting domain-containing protein [candidate division KSB1 bacterium]|nr:T9SS type A sorting domain-containing protein [candidate division KSB1 bacterium]
MKSFLLILALSLPAGTVWGGDWQTVGEMIIPVSGGQAIVHDSSIYIFGGYFDSLGTEVRFIYAYDPARNRWSAVANLNAPRAWFVAAPYGDSLVIAGGIHNRFVTDPAKLFGIELWNFKDAPRIDRINVNFARNFASGVIHQNDFYLFGGLPSPATGDSLRLPYIFGYNIAGGREIFREDNLFAGIDVYDQMLVKRGDEAFIFGGVTLSPTNDVFRFSLKDHTLRRIFPDLLEERAGGEAVLMPNGEIYVMGGYNERAKALRSVEVFKIHDGENYTIRSAPPLRFPRTYAMAVEYEGKIYLFGGVDDLGRPVRAIERLDVSTAVEENDEKIAANFILASNYPNPFNASTTIEFTLPQAQSVNLDIYDVHGRHVKTLAQAKMAAGVHRLRWNGTDDDGEPVASGVYVYRLSTARLTESKKLLLLK